MYYNWVYSTTHLKEAHVANTPQADVHRILRHTDYSPAIFHQFTEFAQKKP